MLLFCKITLALIREKRQREDDIMRTFQLQEALTEVATEDILVGDYGNSISA